jgi:hypothetical protein
MHSEKALLGETRPGARRASCVWASATALELTIATAIIASVIRMRILISLFFAEPVDAGRDEFMLIAER